MKKVRKDPALGEIKIGPPSWRGSLKWAIHVNNRLGGKASSATTTAVSEAYSGWPTM